MKKRTKLIAAVALSVSMVTGISVAPTDAPVSPSPVASAHRHGTPSPRAHCHNWTRRPNSNLWSSTMRVTTRCYDQPRRWQKAAIVCVGWDGQPTTVIHGWTWRRANGDWGRPSTVSCQGKMALTVVARYSPSTRQFLTTHWRVIYHPWNPERLSMFTLQQFQIIMFRVLKHNALCSFGHKVC